MALGKIVACAVSLSIVAAGASAGSVALVFTGLAVGTFVGGALFLAPLRRIAFGAAAPCRISHALKLPLSLALVAVSNYLIGSQAASFILKNARVADGQIAVFSVGVTVAMVSNRALMGGFASVILAAFSRATDADHLARLHSLYVRATTILSMPVLLASVVFAPLVARIWLKGDIGDSVFIINVLVAWSIAARLMGGGAHSAALYSAGLQNTGLVVRAIFAAVSVVATYLAGEHLGIRGAASAAGAVGFLVIAVEWAAVYKMRAIGMPWAALGRLALYSLAAAAPAWLLTLPNRPALTILAIPVFAIGAIAALILARPLSAGEASDIAGHGALGRLLLRLETAPSTTTAALEN
jgi:O-antigen/teichoic acid export membrane protein